VSGTIAHGVPPGAVALVLLLGIGAVAGLTWLKAIEVLAE
jgi:hypothetical protein